MAIEIYPYKKLPWYPHMKPNDRAIWERFIATYPDAYNSCAYDASVGETYPIPEDTDPTLAAMWERQCSWKIDVIGFTPVEIDCIEVKPSAGHKAIAQALNYSLLYEWDNEPPQIIVPTIITDVEMPNVRKLCEHHGIRLIVV